MWLVRRTWTSGYMRCAMLCHLATRSLTLDIVHEQAAWQRPVTLLLHSWRHRNTAFMRETPVAHYKSQMSDIHYKYCELFCNICLVL